MTPATSTIAIDDEVRDQRERLALVGGRERFEVLLGRLRILRGPGARVLDTVVGDHQAPDLFQLARLQGTTPEERADLVGLGRGRALEHRDERKRALAFPQVAP